MIAVSKCRYAGIALLQVYNHIVIFTKLAAYSAQCSYRRKLCVVVQTSAPCGPGAASKCL